MTKIGLDGFVLFGFGIKWYGVLIAAGIALGVLIASRRESRLGLPRDTALDMTLAGVPLAIVGARAYYVAFSWNQYSSDPLSILNIRQGGIAIYGAILGGLLGGLIYARWKKRSFVSLLDLAAPSFAVGQAIGRWGNFFNQEAYGAAVQSAALRFFPVSVYITAEGGWHYATFFYESAWCFTIAAALLTAERKNAFRKKGDVFLWYVLLYALERMLVEGLRTDSLYWGALRISQGLSLLAVLVCGAYIARRSPRKALFPVIPGLTLAVLFGTGAYALMVPAAAAMLAGCIICYKSVPKEKRGISHAQPDHAD